MVKTEFNLSCIGCAYAAVGPLSLLARHEANGPVEESQAFKKDVSPATTLKSLEFFSQLRTTIALFLLAGSIISSNLNPESDIPKIAVLTSLLLLAYFSIDSFKVTDIKNNWLNRSEE